MNTLLPLEVVFLDFDSRDSLADIQYGEKYLECIFSDNKKYNFGF